MREWIFYIALAILVASCCTTQSYESSKPSSRNLFSQNWKRKLFGGEDSSQQDLTTRNSTDERGREGKFFSLFTVVRFANDACMTTSQDNGTCYSSSECSQRGGAASGSCASGFGVCCLFSFTCGQTTSQNNSYFSNAGYPSSYDAIGTCQLSITKESSDISQIRLDFLTMQLTPPEAPDNFCLRDQLLVTGGSRVPTICGANSGQQIYVETPTGVGNTPIVLTVVTSGTGFSRQWRIKVTQIESSSIARADNGCLQYYTGVSGVIQSFNYDATNGRHISNQDYTICIRTESNFCGIAYSVCNGGVFSVSGPTGTTAPGTSVGAQVGSTTCVTDWLTIPCSSDTGRSIQPATATTVTICQDRLCGDAFSSAARPNSTTVISNSRPFRVTVHFDSFEQTVPPAATVPTGTVAQINNRGFCLNYVQQPCTA